MGSAAVLTAAHCCWSSFDGRLWNRASVLLSAHTLEVDKKVYLTRAKPPPDSSELMYGDILVPHVSPGFLADPDNIPTYDGHDVCLVYLHQGAAAKPAPIGFSFLIMHMFFHSSHSVSA